MYVLQVKYDLLMLELYVAGMITTHLRLQIPVRKSKLFIVTHI